MSKSPTDGDSDWSCQVSFIGQEHTVPSAKMQHLHTDCNNAIEYLKPIKRVAIKQPFSP